jgi:phage-related protein
MGQLGEVLEAVMTKNWIGLLIVLISRLADTFSEISDQAYAAQHILDVLFTVIGQMIEDLGPFLNEIFRPLVELFEAFGRIIGMVLRIIIPIISAITQLVDAFSPLQPILNIICLILAVFCDALAWVYNKISTFVRAITWGFIDIGTMATDNVDRLYKAFDQENSYRTNNSTSYSVQGDVYVNIQVDRSCVVGNMRDVAIAIRDEIRLAEKAGY